LTKQSSVWLDELRKERLQSSSRNPGVAALMSFFVMGLGQIYAGHIDRGIMLLAIHLSGIFSSFSLYNKGLIYDLISPMMSTGAMVAFTYCFCVVFILLWIYNIKDAYYLSLFSSFRDWFEVERVLLPILKVQPDNLLSAPEHPVSSLIDGSVETGPLPNASVAEAHDTEFVEVKAETVVTETHEEPVGSRSQEYEEEVSTGADVFYADVDAVSFGGQSWKLYTGLILIFILVGLWFNKKSDDERSPVPEAETLFAMAADLPDPAAVKQIIDQPDLALEARQKAAQTITTTFVASETVIAPEPPVAAEPVSIPFQKGIELMGVQEFAQACAEFEKDLVVAKPDKDTWILILNAFYRSENKLAYELKLRKYLESFSQDSAAWFNLGKTLYDRQAFAEAAQAIIQGLKYDPDNVRGNFLLGSIYFDLKLYADAAASLKKAVAFEPLNTEFVFELAQCLDFSGEKNDAARYYQRVLSIDPSHSEAEKALKRINLVVAQVQNSEPFVNPAIAEDESAVVVIQGKQTAKVIARSESTSGEVLYDDKNLSEAGDSAGEPSVDQPAQEKASELSHQPAGKVLFEASPEALPAPEKELEDVIMAAESDKTQNVSEKTVNQKEPPVKPENRVVQAPIIASASKKLEIDALVYGAAVEKTKKETEPAVQDWDDNLADAVAIENVGFEQAAEAIRKSAFNEYSRGNWERSLPLYLEYLKKKPDPRAYDIVSIIFEKLNMPQDAFEASEHAYNMGFKDHSTLIRLGRLAEETGHFKDGEKYLKMALEKSPHRVDIRIRYARCLAKTGRQDKAIAELESLAKANSSSYSVKTRIETELKQIQSRGY